MVVVLLVLVLQTMKNCLGGHARKVHKCRALEGAVGPHDVTPQRGRSIAGPRLRSDAPRRQVLRFWRVRSIELVEAPVGFHLPVFPVQRDCEFHSRGAHDERFTYGNDKLPILSNNLFIKSKINR